MRISRVEFESSVRYMGWKLKSPIMGHGGEVVVHLKNGDRVFRGGTLHVTISNEPRGIIVGGYQRYSTIVEEIKIPLMKPYRSGKFKIPIRRLSVEPGMPNLMRLELQIHDDRKTLTFDDFPPLILIDGSLAKERARDKATLVVAILTFLGVIVSIILEAVWTMLI